MLRMSTLFLRTLREDPADAEVPSHRLLVRAGYVRRVAPGIYSWLPLGVRMLANVEPRRARGDGPDRRAGGALPGAAAPRALRGERPLDRVRRPAVPPQGPARQRLPARAHARGAVHADGEGRVQLVQGPAGHALPGPDEVPRRGASPRRHPARPRVRHEGQLLLRPRRRRAAALLRPAPRGLRPHLRAARHGLPDRLGGQRGDGRQRVGGVPRARAHRRGHVRLLHRPATTRPTPRPSPARPAEPRTPRPSPRSRSSTPPTPRRSTRSSRCSPTWAIPSTRRRHAQERRRHCCASPTGRPSRSSSASPATARSTSSGSRPTSAPPRCCRSTTSTPAPSSSRATSARRASRESATSSTRSSSRAAPGRRARTSRASTRSTW